MGGSRGENLPHNSRTSQRGWKRRRGRLEQGVSIGVVLLLYVHKEYLYILVVGFENRDPSFGRRKRVTGGFFLSLDDKKRRINLRFTHRVSYI